MPQGLVIVLNVYVVGAVVASVFYSVPALLGLLDDEAPRPLGLLIGWVAVTVTWPHAFYRTYKTLRDRGAC